jgi:hypothetical protein
MQDDALVVSQMQRHVQRAQHEFGLQMIRHRPADESAGYGMLCPAHFDTSFCSKGYVSVLAGQAQEQLFQATS